MNDHVIHHDPAVVAIVEREVRRALTEAADMLMDQSLELRQAYRDHNAGRDPSKPRRRPDLDTWANADEAASHAIRRRIPPT